MEEIIISVIAGILAGLGTGFAGLSAAVFIAPMLVCFLGMDSFSAIGIALASDVLASAVSAFNYARSGNTDLRRCRLLLITVLIFAVIGSVVSHIFTGFEAGESVMSLWLVVATLLLGLKLAFFPSKNDKPGQKPLPLPDALIMILSGIYIGFVCGFQGTGGGLMLLFAMNILLGIEFKKAVGSGVVVMTVTALIGAASHFTLRGMPDEKVLIVCMISTLAGAYVSSMIANRIRPLTLKRITGGMMTAAGIAMALMMLL